MPTAATNHPADDTSGPVAVTAVVVAHDGSRWLPGLRAAIEGQTRPPDLVVAADTSAGDDTAPLLTAWVGESRTVRCPPTTGFGDAAQAALDAGSGSPDWIWLLHDDCVPDPDALAALLRVAGRDDSVGIVGPKVRALGGDTTVLLEVGVTIARSGRRETLLERRERDQGQHDGTRRVLAVGTAGLLVRRDVWDELGGMDPRLPLLRDDVDLGWRATLAGYRVLCVTDAVVLHAEAATRRRRVVHVKHRLHRLDRAHGSYVLLVNLPLLLLPVALVSLTLGSLLRAAGYLAGKLPRHAADEIGALGAVLGRPDRLVAARRRRRRTRRVPARSALPLLAPRSAGLRNLMETAVLVAGTSTGDVAGGRHRGRPAGQRRGTSAPATGPTAEEAEDLPSWGTSMVRRLVLRPSVGLVAAMALLALLAARGLLGAGRLMGGALLPAPDTATELWRSYVTAWHPVGIGSDAVSSPYVAVLAALSSLLGSPERALDLLLLGAVPLAAATGYLAARRVVRSVPLRVWAATTYALLPPTLGAVAAGRVGTAVLAVLLPLVGLAVTRALGLDLPAEERAGSGRATAAGVLLLAVATAFVPLVAPLALVAALVALLVVRGRNLLRLAVLVVGPWALLLPWLPALVSDPQLLLLEAGLPGPGLSEAAPDPVDTLLLRAGGPGAAPLLLTVPLLLVGLAGLLRPAGRRPIVIGWLLALTGLVAAVVQSRLDVTAPTLETAVPAWPGPALVLAGAGLVTAAAAGADGVRARVQGSSFGWRQPAAVVLAVAAAAMPLALAGWWVVAGAGGPLDRRDPVLLPAFVAAEGDEPDRPRTLVLRQRAEDGDTRDLAYALLRAEGPRTGDAEVAPRAEATHRTLDPVVADLASGRGGDAAARLVPYGVRYVLLTRPADPTLARGVDAVPGMVRVSGARGSVLWRVDYPTGRLRLLPPDAPVVDSDGSPPEGQVLGAGQVRARVDLPAGEPGRLLVLADPVDPGWQARVDGRELSARRYDGWAQAFEVPAAGGRLEVRHEQGVRTLLLWLQLGAAALAVLLALPQVRTREDDDLVEADLERVGPERRS